MRRLVALAAVLALSLAACGGGSDDDTDPLAGGSASNDHAGHADHMGNPTAHCEPSGTAVNLVAQGTKFNTNCLAAPADRPFTINFDNKDSTPHNIQILASHSATEVLFDSEIIPSGTRTLNVPGLKAGTLAFHCKIHPGQMSGTFVVK